jgi:integrase
MRWTDLDLAERRWTIPGAVSKNGRPVQVRLSEEVATILLRRQEETQGREWVFPSPKDPTAHVADPKRAWERVIASAKLSDVRMHDLRRTGGAFAALAGASGAQIAAVLGHRDLRSAKHYVDLRGDAGELVDVLGKMLLGDGKGGAA